MGIKFAQYEERSRKYLIGYGVAIVVGGLTAISSNPEGFGIAQLLLAASFVLIAMYMGSRISDDYGEQAFLASELTADEYMALNARLERYPDLRDKIRQLLPESGKVSYADARRMQEIVDSHVPPASPSEQEALEEVRKALYRTTNLEA